MTQEQRESRPCLAEGSEAKTFLHNLGFQCKYQEGSQWSFSSPPGSSLFHSQSPLYSLSGSPVNSLGSTTRELPLTFFFLPLKVTRAFDRLHFCSEGENFITEFLFNQFLPQGHCILSGTPNNGKTYMVDFLYLGKVRGVDLEGVLGRLQPHFFPIISKGPFPITTLQQMHPLMQPPLLNTKFK